MFVAAHAWLDLATALQNILFTIPPTMTPDRAKWKTGTIDSEVPNTRILLRRGANIPTLDENTGVTDELHRLFNSVDDDRIRFALWHQPIP